MEISDDIIFQLSSKDKIEKKTHKTIYILFQTLKIQYF